MNEQSFLPKSEQGPTPRDISQEFLSMDLADIRRLIKSFGPEVPVTITIDWIDLRTARKLKALNDDPRSENKISASIRATEEQYRQDVNAFESGVKWIKI